MANLYCLGRCAQICHPPAARRPAGFALDTAESLLEELVELLGYAGSFLAASRGCFLATVCHPVSFREPFRAWQRSSEEQLVTLVSRAREPPVQPEAETDAVLAMAMEHAEVELLITELLAAPKSISSILLQYGHQMKRLLRWIVLAQAQGCGRQAVDAAIQELNRRAVQMAAGGWALLKHLPDPLLPSRWAAWVELQAGIPEGYCQRYLQQRQKVSQLWVTTRQTLLSALELIEATLKTTHELRAGDGSCIACVAGAISRGWLARSLM
ncbi:unnamed protein product [Effrenium voratum]|nr:unnamed protein product [Effrenium voratum]